MDDSKILDIFYTRVVPEATTGKIDCFFSINMVFNLVIDNIPITRCKDLGYEGLLIPTLKITNRDIFDNYLIEYVRIAESFYSDKDFRFLDDLGLIYNDNLENLKEEYKIKYIICTLFANATSYDFENPIAFLKSRVEMLNNHILDNKFELDFGYLDTIGARLSISEEKSPIKAETPYRLIGHLEFDDGYRLELPEIYAGKTENKYQLYGIQKTTNSEPLIERDYLKKIRKGMIAKINGAPEHYFLAVMILLSLCHDKEIEVSPFLIERWNAKRISLVNKVKREPNISLEEVISDQERIQNSITDILIRYFTKLEDVTEGMEIGLAPFEGDANLHVTMNNEINSRSVLFNELFYKAKDMKKKNHLGR